MALAQHAAAALAAARAARTAALAASPDWLLALALLLLAARAARLAAGAAAFVWAHALRPAADLRRLGGWAVVTGATDGIGRAYAEELARRGLNLVLVSRTQAKLDAAAAALAAAHGVQVRTLAADLTRISPAEADRIGAALAGLDVGLLVNNAGQSYDHCEFLEAAPRGADGDLVAINCLAPVLLSAAVLPGMKARRRGAIVNIGSANGALPAVPLLATYAGSKAFVDQFSRSLAAEAAPYGVRVHNQAPLFVATKMARIRRPRLDAPSAAAWARAAAAAVGRGPASATPYWVHDLMWAVVRAAPAWLVTWRVGAMHAGFRTAYYLKRAREAAAAKAE